MGESSSISLLPFQRVSPSVCRLFENVDIFYKLFRLFSPLASVALCARFIPFVCSKIEYFLFARKFENWIWVFDSRYFFVLLRGIGYDNFLISVPLSSTDNVHMFGYGILHRWLRENCSIPIVDILYKVRNAKCSLVTLQIDGMWFNGEYRRETGVSMRVSPFVFIPMKA